MQNIAANNERLRAEIGSAGSLCVRLRTPSVGAKAEEPSIHSYGLAIDITIRGIAPENVVGFDEDFKTIIAAFNTGGWFWGGGFVAESYSHFEVAEETLQSWVAFGLLNTVSK
jgi:D-alanyl-D-alanine carboxypeptidase-like protein